MTNAAAERRFDCLVIGESIAGIAAAIRAAEHGLSVALMDYSWDTATIPDQGLIFPTPLNPAEMPAVEFGNLALRQLRNAGVDTAVGRGDFTFNLAAGEPRVGRRDIVAVGHWDRLTARSLIFSPNGSERKENVAPFSELLNFGVSLSAWSDAALFRGQPVCIFGSGIRLLQQALVASKSAGDVHVLFRQPPDNSVPTRLVDLVMSKGNVTLYGPSAVSKLISDAQGSLSAVAATIDGNDRVIPARLLFIANPVSIDWGEWGDESAARQAADQAAMFTAGLAAGIDFGDHSAQHFDGVRAAEACVSLLSRF